MTDLATRVDGAEGITADAGVRAQIERLAAGRAASHTVPDAAPAVGSSAPGSARDAREGAENVITVFVVPFAGRHP